MGAFSRSHPSDQAQLHGLGGSRFDRGEWRSHDRGPQPAGLEDCTVDVVGSDGLTTGGWWPQNIVWANVIRYRIHVDGRRQWAERIAEQFSVTDPAAIDAIEEGLARGAILARIEARSDATPKSDAAGTARAGSSSRTCRENGNG